MNKVRMSLSTPRQLAVAGTLCAAIAAVTTCWASDDPATSHDAQSSQLMPESEDSPTSSGSPTAYQETPNQLIFSTTHLQQVGENLQLILDVDGGSPEPFDGLFSTQADGHHTRITVQEQKGEARIDGTISAANQAGHHGRLHVRHLSVSLDDILQGAVPGMPANPIFDDDVYQAFRQLLTVLNIKKDYLPRDALIQADRAVIIRRANGDLDIGLYRMRPNNSPDGEQIAGTLEYMGQLRADGKMRYQLAGPISEPEFTAHREAIIKELQELQAAISEQNMQIEQIMAEGRREDLEVVIAQVEQDQARFNELYKELGMATQFEWFAITESIDYSASNWVKFDPEGSLEITSQAVNYKVMSAILEARAGQELARQTLDDLKTYIYQLAEQTRSDSTRISAGQTGVTLGENRVAYLTRQLATAWNAIQGLAVNRGWFSREHSTFELPAQYAEDPTIEVPVLRMKNTSQYVSSGLTLDATLEQIKSVVENSSLGGQPDKFIISEDQLNGIRASLSKSGWRAWLKSFIWSDAYQPDQQSDMIREILRQRGTDLHHLFTVGINGGVPIHIIDGAEGIDDYHFVTDTGQSELKARAIAELNRPTPHVLTVRLESDGRKATFGAEPLTEERQAAIETALVDKELSRAEQAVETRLAASTPDNQGIVPRVLNRALGTAYSAGMGWITGLSMQYTVDGISKYYNEGVLPWNYSKKDSEEMGERAFHTGAVMAANAAVSDLVLPYVAQGQGYFDNVSGQALLNRSLTGKYEASIAGGIAGVTTRTLMSGYKYWGGELSASELAWEVADAAGRAVPVTLGSVAGHALFPYRLQVPVISTILPIGFIGAVGGSIAGNAAYDSVKYYARSGLKKLGDYYHSSSSVESIADSDGTGL